MATKILFLTNFFFIFSEHTVNFDNIGINAPLSFSEGNPDALAFGALTSFKIIVQ